MFNKRPFTLCDRQLRSASVVGTASFFNSQVCPYKSQRIPPRDFRGHHPCLNIVFFVSDHRSLLTHAFVSGPLAESAKRDWLG
jgi:hypothetical protein